jgi:serine/threonine protein kinase
VNCDHRVCCLLSISWPTHLTSRSFRPAYLLCDFVRCRDCTTEIRALRTLSRRTAHATRILHHGALELTHPSGDLLALLSDASEFGTLDRFTAMQVRYTVVDYMQSFACDRLRCPTHTHICKCSSFPLMCFSPFHANTQAQLAAAAAAASANANNGGANSSTPPSMAYPVADLQSMCVQLIEGLIQCHELNIRHRDIRPANILVSRCADELYGRQFNRGLVLKYTNFVPSALLSLCHHNGANEAEAERWLAPEVDHDARRNGTRFQAASDVWSLGLTIYYLASGGHLPFDSHKQVRSECC